MNLCVLGETFALFAVKIISYRKGRKDERQGRKESRSFLR
jgi:hypothetical protein